MTLTIKKTARLHFSLPASSTGSPSSKLLDTSAAGIVWRSFHHSASETATAPFALYGPISPRAGYTRPACRSWLGRWLAKGLRRVCR